MLHLSKQQKAVVFGSWLGWSLDGYDLVLMLLIIPSVSQLFFPSEDPTFSLLASFAPFALALNIIAGSIIILVGAKLNPETRDTDLA